MMFPAGLEEEEMTTGIWMVEVLNVSCNFYFLLANKIFTQIRNLLVGCNILVVLLCFYGLITLLDPLVVMVLLLSDT